VSLLPFWPTLAEIDTCIRTEAETAEEAILLAVHEPARLVRRAAYSKDESEADEKQLLEAFTSENLAGGSLVLLISGTSGVGKSHMIRWLAAQLHRHKRSRDMHIITIPKSASLRNVVERILEPLEGTEYDDLRRELNSSVASVSDRDAAIRLASELKIVLTGEAGRLAQQLREGKVAESSRTATSMRLHHARGLPSLIQDAALDDHFIKGVLPRIVSRALHGLPPGAAEEHDSLGRFTAEDLTNLEEKGLDHAARAVETYYRTVLNALDGRNREMAVDVLKSALDPALRRVFNLERAASGMTIEDIVDRVRMQLLKDDKELVLLVEDFAALAGIQESLLKLSIVEATHAGRKVRAVLRTALAVTDGYMEHRDTILTRAKFEWIVKSRFEDEKQLLDHCCNLAGRYLNAARWGARNLSIQFSDSRERGAALSNWTPTFETGDLSADEAETLDAFGSTRHGHRLFPLNRDAISGLCRQVLPRSGGRMEFNSRALINGVLRDPLQKRPSFESGRFPEAGFGNVTLSPDVQIALNDSSLSGDEMVRARAVLFYWGDNPESLSKAQEVPLRIFQAFSIKPPFAAVNGRSKPSVKYKSPEAPLAARLRVEENETVDSDAIDKFKQRLRAWAEGGGINQLDARQIRSEWGAAIRDRIDAMDLRIRDQAWENKQGTTISTWIHIPGATTGQPDIGNPKFPPVYLAPATDRDSTGRISKALLAMRRRDERNGWAYSDAEEDFACYTWLLDALTRQAEQRIEREIERNLSYLVPRLRLQTALLGLSGGAESTPVEQLARPISDEWAAELAIEGIPTPLELYSSVVARASESRSLLQEQLFRYAACFQGTGKIASAIDAPRIASYLNAEVVTDPNIAASFPELREHLLQLVPDRLRVGADRTVQWLRATRSTFEQQVGEEGINDLAVKLEQVHNLAKEHGLVERTDLIHGTLDKLKEVSASQIAKIRTAFLLIEKTQADTALEDVLQTLARVPIRTLLHVLALFNDAETFIAQVERKLGAQIQTLEDADPAPVADSILTLLTRMQETADGLSVNPA
jgi:hypothetical protein